MTSSKILRQGTPAEVKVQGFWHWRNVRFQISLLLCFNFLALALMRNSLGIAMVCMVNSTAIGILEDEESMERISNATLLNDTDAHIDLAASYCPITSSVRHEYEGEFVWDTGKQGMLFAALYWGSFTCLLGRVADRYSPRHILFSIVLLNVVCSMLTPIAALYGGYVAMFVIRLLMGLGQGLQKPTVTAFAARWIPVNERSTAISIYTAGNQMSNIVGMPLNAWLCHLRWFWGGWPLIFLASGSASLVWCVIWHLFVTNRPETHKKISESERGYIISTLKSQNLRKEGARIVPWRKLLCSMPVMACCICSLVNGLVVSTTSSYIPTYFMEVLHLDLYSNGFYSAMPYVSQWMAKFLFAWLADHLIQTGRFSPTMSTKVFNTAGSFSTAAFLISCSFLTCAHTHLAITFLCLSMASFAAYAPGYWTSMVSIAPVFSGTVSALTTTTNQIGSIVAPYLVGLITVHGTRAEWQVIFGLLAAAMVLSGLFYAIFGSAEIQEWAKEKSPPRLIQNASSASPKAAQVDEEAFLSISAEQNGHHRSNGSVVHENEEKPLSPEDEQKDSHL